jgi:Na+/melibiose symporter-like transporter
MMNLIPSNLHIESAPVASKTSVLAAARQARRRFDGTRGLAALLLGAVVAATVTLADQLVDTWADDHLMALWIVLWVVGFATAALFASTARGVARRVVAASDAWSAQQARTRADRRMWAAAMSDPRIMADIRAAQQRAAATLPLEQGSMQEPFAYSADAARRTNINDEISAMHTRRSMGYWD